MRKSEAILKQASNAQDFVMSSSSTIRNPYVVSEDIGRTVSSSQRIETSSEKVVRREITKSLNDASNYIEEQEPSTQSIETSPYKAYCPSTTITRQNHADRALLQISESLLSSNS